MALVRDITSDKSVGSGAVKSFIGCDNSSYGKSGCLLRVPVPWRFLDYNSSYPGSREWFKSVAMQTSDESDGHTMLC